MLPEIHLHNNLRMERIEHSRAIAANLDQWLTKALHLHLSSYRHNIEYRLIEAILKGVLVNKSQNFDISLNQGLAQSFVFEFFKF